LFLFSLTYVWLADAKNVVQSFLFERKLRMLKAKTYIYAGRHTFQSTGTSISLPCLGGTAQGPSKDCKIWEDTTRLKIQQPELSRLPMVIRNASGFTFYRNVLDMHDYQDALIENMHLQKICT